MGFRFVSCFYLLFPLFFTSVSSELSSTQKSLMDNLYELLHNQTTVPWSADTDPCSWVGVACTNSSSITKLSLSNFGLSISSFLPLVCGIDSLEALDVSRNFLTSIPDMFLTDCGKVEGLKLLNFSLNRVAGMLPSFNGFSSLEFLDLSNNLLSGDIGLQLDGLAGLRSLNLSYNHFNGSIPTNLGKSKSLEELELSHNFFQGPIPEGLADYQNLTVIDLSANSLSGTLPDRLRELPKLEVLVLSANSLTGTIPTSLSSITTLSRFAANQNQFRGLIPSGITKYLKNLDLSYNRLWGSIPDGLLSQPNLQTVDLSYNMLQGSIPENLSSSLIRLRLGSNGLNGSIPSEICGKLQKLVYLELENNSLSGSIPSGLGSCTSLQLLSLAQNNFTGVLPRQLGNLSQLQVLKLQNNHFEGEIPSEITQLTNLSTLNISWNLISGTIPSSISGLKRLLYLDLQDNMLSGSIPRNIGSMSSLVELQVGGNDLSGDIPSMPPKLQYSLNLSNNRFEGPVPDSLQTATELEILDLSNNRFSGDIPTFLTQIPSLTQLDLANNNLSGVVPVFNRNVIVTTKPGNEGLIYPTNAKGQTGQGHKRTAAVVVAAVLSAALFTVVVVVSVLLSRRFYRINNIEIQSREDVPLPLLMEGYILTTNSIHRSAIDFNKAMEAVANPLNFVLKTRFSTYYKAVMPSGASYFVKKLNWNDNILQLVNHENFGKELEALGKLNNSNIITPLAYMLSTGSAYIFYEYAYKGTLFDILHKSSGTVLDWTSRYSIAVGVAQGLAYLHGCPSGPILLFDLSSKSIMLKSITEPQIGDIEVFKVIDPSKSTSSISAVAGSVGYIPPEYAYTMRITMSGNVYSFGVVLLELLTGKPAVREGTELAKWVLSKSEQQQNWDHILDLNISRTSVFARNQMLQVLKIALACVSLSSEARPKMKSVLRMLLNAR